MHYYTVFILETYMKPVNYHKNSRHSSLILSWFQFIYGAKVQKNSVGEPHSLDEKEEKRYQLKYDDAILFKRLDFQTL